jgi:MFS family permease
MLTGAKSLTRPYVGILREDQAWKFYLWSLPPRLGGAMLGLGLVWLIHWSTESYAAAGLVAGGYALAGAVVGPYLARLVDTFGQARTVPPLLVMNAVAIVALVVAAAARGPIVVLVGIAAVAATCGPQFSALSRARWLHLHGRSPRLSTAFALESLTDEIPFVLGPALVGTLSGLVHPAVGPLTAVVLLVAGGIPFALQRSTAPAPSKALSGTEHRGVFRPRLLLLLGVFAAFGLIFGAMQVSVTALAVQTGRPGLAGPMYSAFSLLSMIAGVAYGAIKWKWSIATRLIAAMTALAVLALPLLFVDRQPWLAIAVALPGIAIAPALIAANTLAGELASRRAFTQTFTWIASATALGLAGGQSLAGQAADAIDVHVGFAISIAAAATGAAITAFLRASVPKHSTKEHDTLRA